MSVRLVLAAGIVIATITTAISGFVYTARTSPAQNCETDCRPWQEYGWPFAWRSDWPVWLLDSIEDTHSIYNHDRYGISWGSFAWSAGAWFLMVVPPLVLGARGVSWMRRRLRRRSAASS
jgi:hypothetical protein